MEHSFWLRDINKKGTDGQYELTWSTWIFGALSSTLQSFVCNGALHVSLQHLQWIVSPHVRFFWYLYPSNTSIFPPLSPFVTYGMSDSFWHFSGCGGRKRSCKIFPSSLTTQKTHYPGLIKMSAFDWSMTRWYNTHATGWWLRNVTESLYVAIHDVKIV